MSGNYAEDDFLLLSGIQHMAFCERQWALIHLEQVWAENIRTVEGQQLHERTDDPFADESRNKVRIIRAMPVVCRARPSSWIFAPGAARAAKFGIGFNGRTKASLR